jgi:cytidine deaminase
MHNDHMKYLDNTEINQETTNLLLKARDEAEHSVSENAHKVGCAIETTTGNIYSGATIAHPRIIGATCAERMAIDQLYLHSEKPKLIAVVGKLNRDTWRQDNLCTPCGLCLEMFWELQMKTGVGDIEFLCANWDLDRILSVKLSELFPRFEAVKR